MSFLGDLKKKLEGGVAQIAPSFIDHGATYSTVVNNQPVPTPKPATTTVAPARLPSASPPRFAQPSQNSLPAFKPYTMPGTVKIGGLNVNNPMAQPQGQAPTQPGASVLHDLTHNPITNYLGNSIKGEFQGVPNSSAANIIKLGAAQVSHNQQAQNNAVTQLSKPFTQPRQPLMITKNGKQVLNPGPTQQILGLANGVGEGVPTGDIPKPLPSKVPINQQRPMVAKLPDALPNTPLSPPLAAESKALESLPRGGRQEITSSKTISPSSSQASQPLDTKPQIPARLPKVGVESTKSAQIVEQEQAVPLLPFDAQQYIADQTKLQQAAKGKSSKLQTIRKELSTKMIDSLSPIEKPVENAVGRSTALPLRNQLDRSLRSDTIAGQFAKDNGLHNIVNSVPDTKAFDQYLIAKHAQDLEANGVKTGRNLNSDQQLINQLAPQYDTAAKNLSGYNNKLLDQTVKYGLISKDTATYLKQKYPNYVPFDRIFSETELANKHVGTGGSPASLSKQTVIQRIQGSDRQISSPLENILAKTHDVTAQGERNLAAKEIIKTKSLPGNPLGIVPLRTAADVKARIDLYSQAKELKPAQVKLQQLMKTEGRWARKLQSQLDVLNQKGLDASLKAQQSKVTAPILSGNRDVLAGAKRVTNPLRDIPTLTGTVKTKQFSRSMTATETRQMVNNLINMSKPQLERIKSRIATKENNLAPVLDKIEELRAAVEGVKNNRQTLIDEAKLHADALAKGKDTISTITDGIKEIYQVNPEVAAAAKSLNKQQLGLVGKILSYPTRTLRLGATGINVGFTAANVAKDIATAGLNSEHPLHASVANPHVFLDALAASFRHSGKNYAELTRQGAGGTSFDIARNSAADTISKIRAQRNVGTKVLYTVRHPEELLRAVENTIGRSEEFGRAMQYFGNKSAALKEGKTLAQATTYGADAARTNTTNFARAGEYGRVLNSVLPYFNAGLQGSRTLVRNLKLRPAQTTAKLVVGAFVPVAAVTAWNLNDPARKQAYDDIPDYEKQGNIIIVPPNPHKDPKTGRWNVIKIPVSQEVANANNIVRNGIEALQKDTSFDFGQMAANLAGTTTSLNVGSTRQVLNQVTPQAIKPAIEVATNQNLYTGNKIVPDSKANLAPRDQYGDGTSGTSKVLGRLTNTSPYQIDNALRTTFAGAGQNALNTSDNLLAKMGIIPASDIKGKPIDAGITSRFYTAAGGSGYTNADKAFSDAQKKLAGNPAFQNLNQVDKAKELNRLKTDLIATETRKYDAKFQTGQYSPTNATPQTKLSKNQTTILQSGLNLNDYTKTTEQKAAAKAGSSTTSPADKYKAAQDNFNTNQKNMSTVQKYTAQSNLNKLKVQKDYSNDVINLYGLSKAKLNDFLSKDPNGKALYDQLVAYDNAQYDAGLITSKKFKYGLGSASTSSGSGSKSGGKSKKLNASDFKTSTPSLAGLAKLLEGTSASPTTGRKVSVPTIVHAIQNPRPSTSGFADIAKNTALLKQLLNR